MSVFAIQTDKAFADLNYSNCIFIRLNSLKEEMEYHPINPLEYGVSLGSKYQNSPGMN